MMVPDSMDLAAYRIPHSKLHQRYRGKEGKNHGCCGRRRWALIPGDVLSTVAEIQADLPLDHRIHEQSYDCEHGQGRNPCGFLQPHGTDRGGILDPAKARFHGDVLFLICLEQLGIRTPFWPHRGREDGPHVRVLRGHQGLWVYPEAIAALDLRDLRLRRTTSPRPRLRHTDRFDLVAQAMVTPRPRLASTPSLPTPFVLRHGRFGIGDTRKPSSFDTLDVLGDTCGFLGLGCGIGPSGLGGQLAGVHDQKAELGHVLSPVRILHNDAAHDTLPVPAPWRLLL